MIWIGRFISIAAILQTVEMFWIPFFRPELLATEFPRPLRWILRFTKSLLIVRLMVALAALFFPSSVVVFILLSTTWMIAVRWRGTFNGGSDIMTFHILLAWFVSLCFPSATQVCVYYVAVQVILSFAVAGLAKLSNPAWRNGLALRKFLGQWDYAVASGAGLTLAWAILLFETLFPLALFKPWPFLIAALFFQLANTYVFGLNRFFFTWLAGYPAVLILAHSIF